MIRYKFIQEKQWKGIHQKLQALNADIASATNFVREIDAAVSMFLSEPK